MTLSPMQIKLYLAIALIAALAVFELVTRLDDRRKIRSGAVRDQREKDTLFVRHNAVPYPKWRIWSEGLLIIAAGAMVAATMFSVIKYQEYGAFYDASWRSPEVEKHFLFSSKANQDLESQWLRDPENFPWNDQRICLVKLGCEDCERIEPAIRQLEAEGYDLVFSTSALGREIVSRYGVDYVPSVILNGMVIQLRSGDSVIPQGDRISDGQQAQEILDDLLSGPDTDGRPFGAADPDDPDYTKYGTKAAIEAAEKESGQNG